MKNFVLVTIIAVLAVAAVFFGWNYFKQRSVENAVNLQPPASTSSGFAGLKEPPPGSGQTQSSVQLSEQSNRAKYDEYLSGIYLGKLSISQKIGVGSFPTQTNIFTKGVDQFCTMTTLKKAISSGSLAVAIYDTISKTYQQPKMVFPMALSAGGTGGCSDLTQPVGKYEYKLYIDDILAAVLPFEVK